MKRRSVAWPALVRRDEEIETAAGLSEAPRALVEFRSGAAAVGVFGLAHAPSFLRVICSIPSFGISEIRRERLLHRYQQKYQQNGRLGSLRRELLRVFSMRAKIFPKRSGIELRM
jgi:hypothetical protein